MNSGQAQASQAGHSMISSMKGKQKARGTPGESLIGSLLALIPGATAQNTGFKVTMQQIMDGKLGLGTRLTRTLWDGGNGFPKGINVPEGEPESAILQKSGLTNPPVLDFSEAARGSPIHQPQQVTGKQVPIAAPQGVQSAGNPADIGADSGMASKKATQPKSAAVADPTKPQRSSEGKSAPDLSRSKSDWDKSITNGKASIEGASVPEFRAKSTSMTTLNPDEQHQSQEKVGFSQEARIRGRNGIPHTDDLSGKGKTHIRPDASYQRLEDSSEEVVQTNRSVGRPQAPHVDGKFLQSNLRSAATYKGEQTQPEGDSQKQVISKQRISSQSDVQKPPILEFRPGQGPRAEFGSNGIRKEMKGRIVDQSGLEVNRAAPGNQDGSSKTTPVLERSGFSGSREQQAAAPKVVSTGGTGRHAASSAIESGRNTSSDIVDSLTAQNDSRNSMMGKDTPHRGFAKPVAVGIPELTRNRKSAGKETPALMGQSLLSPAQSTNETSAVLGTLARVTVAQYFRFANSEQTHSVFTFNGGSLGNVQLSFRETESGTVLHIVVESSEIRHVLQRTLPSLERAWHQEGLNFSDVNVEVGDTGYQWDPSGASDQTRIPTLQESVETPQVTPEIIEQAIKDYGYNTLEFVA